MNKVYIIGFILLVITAVFAKKEYFTDPTNINNDSSTRFLNAIKILTPAQTADAVKLVDVSDNDVSGNDVSGNWLSQFNGMQFLKDIRSVVRDEIIANNIATSNTAKASSIENKEIPQSPSIVQGKVFSNPAYDMNQYIRKDSIPCYACSVDY